MITQSAAQKTVDVTEESYDDVPYQSMSYPQTHPQHLYTVGTLFGLSPPDFRTARVLEIGCAGGGNLIPQAVLYPEGTYTGYDLSAEQIREAEIFKAGMNLSNVTFRQQDILKLDLKAEAGKYDYIIAHGVYSWTPEDVRQRLLAFCGEALSPDGLAVVSYNTLPGWNAIRSLREMMIYHSARFEKAEDKVRQARSLLDFLIESVPASNAGYRAVIEAERAILGGMHDSYLFHEHLESVNAQFYLHDFVASAAENGLEYVGDTAVASMYVGNMPAKAVESLEAVGDLVAQEQYMDFVTNRRFRTSILCRKGQKMTRDLNADKIFSFLVSPAYSVLPQPAPTSVTASFAATNGARFSAGDAASVALFTALAARGGYPVAPNELVRQVSEDAKIPAEKLRAALITNGLKLVMIGGANIHSVSSPATPAPGAKPVAFSVARHQAAQKGCAHVANAMGASVRIDDVSCILLSHMDGTYDVPALVDVLSDAISDGRVKAKKDGRDVTDGSVVRDNLEQTVRQVIGNLAARHLLVA